jgi:large subunit ribosomal protein L4e
MAKRVGKGKKPGTAKKAKKAPSLKAGEVFVYSLEGEAKASASLPPVFDTELRVDVIRRAVTAFQANRRQAYGPSPRAGMRHSVASSGKGHGVSRVPRLRGSYTGAEAPGTVGGRRAHPPRPERRWAKKINEKERRLARKAALAATKDRDLVLSRGHRVPEDVTLPLVVEGELEALEAKLEEEAPDAPRFAAKGREVLGNLRLYDDVVRADRGTRIRAGRGKMRGRRYRRPRSVLVVASDARRVARLFRNLPGVDVTDVANVNAEDLAPGGTPGRLTLFTEQALDALRRWP